MRPNQNQDPGEQKKSVFDRLGRQLDAGRAASRRSPAQYGEHPMHPGIHEQMDFSRYMRGDGHPDMDWRYQQGDRRNMAGFGRDRHMSQVGPPPMPMPMPPPPPPPHYDVDGRQMPPYYQHGPAPPHFQPGPPGMNPQLMGGPESMPMPMHHQRRSSPKYDRHGNPIRGTMRAEHGMSSPRNFMGPPMPGHMMPPGPYDMMPMRPGMYPPDRMAQNPEMGPQMHTGRLLPDDRFMEPPGRFMQQQQMKPPMLMNPEMAGMPPNFEAPRQSKWRERRDVITNLDRQTAQSSSKTNSLRSSLQQQDSKGNMSKKAKNMKADQQQNVNKQQSDATKVAAEAAAEKKEPAATAKTANKDDPSSSNLTEHQDISDGEIIDDEDSSDDSDTGKVSSFNNPLDNDLASRQNRHKGPYARKPSDSLPIFETGKRRRLLDRDEYSMDYETISDEELNDFMSEKKLADDDQVDDRGMKKNSSEIELLNALGLDWANLIELTKQSKKDTQTTDSALRRFALPNFIPTLGVTKDLAGPEIYDLLMKVAQ